MVRRKSRKLPLAILAMELAFTIAFLAMLFGKILLITAKPFSIALSSEGFDYFILIALGVLALLFYFLLKRKAPEMAALQATLTALFKQRAKEKVKHAREDRRVVASIIIELMLIMIIAVALYAVLDEKIALIKEGVPWIGKAIIIGVIVVFGLYAYVRFTMPFHEVGGYYVTKTKKTKKFGYYYVKSKDQLRQPGIKVKKKAKKKS